MADLPCPSTPVTPLPAADTKRLSTGSSVGSGSESDGGGGGGRRAQYKQRRARAAGGSAFALLFPDGSDGSAHGGGEVRLALVCAGGGIAFLRLAFLLLPAEAAEVLPLPRPPPVAVHRPELRV